MSIEDIRQSITVPELLDELGVEVGSNDKMECPWHTENTPSCHVYEDHIYCFGCGGAGDVIDVLKAYTGWPFVKCLSYLEEASEDLPKRERVGSAPKELPDFTGEFRLAGFLTDEPFLFQLAQARWRGVREFNPFLRVLKNELLIPHFHNGRVVGVKTRGLLVGSCFKSAWPGSVFTTQLYVARSVPASDIVILCEGESDSWAMASHTQGYNVFALPSGAGCWRKEWLDQLSPFSIVYTAFDNDAAGKKATEVVRKAVGFERWKELKVPQLYNDVNEACAAGWRPLSGQ